MGTTDDKQPRASVLTSAPALGCLFAAVAVVGIGSAVSAILMQRDLQARTEAERVEDEQRAEETRVNSVARSQRRAESFRSLVDELGSASAAERWVDAYRAATSAGQLLQSEPAIARAMPDAFQTFENLRSKATSRGQRLSALADVAAVEGATDDEPEARYQRLESIKNVLSNDSAETSGFMTSETQDAVRRLDRLMTRLRPRAQAARTAREHQEEATRAESERRARLLAVCGNGPDAYTMRFTAESLMRERVADGRSLQVLSCGTPGLANENECWVSVCRVRGRNGFGALVDDTYHIGIKPPDTLTLMRNLRFN